MGESAPVISRKRIRPLPPHSAQDRASAGLTGISCEKSEWRSDAFANALGVQTGKTQTECAGLGLRDGEILAWQIVDQRPFVAARHRIGRLVAIKILHPHATHGDENLFEQEMDLLGSVPVTHRFRVPSGRKPLPPLRTQ